MSDFLYAFTDSLSSNNLKEAKLNMRKGYCKDPEHTKYMFAWKKDDFPAIKESNDSRYEEYLLRLFFDLSIEEKEKLLGIKSEILQ